MLRGLLAGLLALTAAQAEPAGTLVPARSIPSAETGSAMVSVWLPPGYATSGARYPVLYMQDGQNLFDAAVERSGSFNHHVWGADTVAARLIAENRVRPFIIVGVDNRGIERARQYYPQAAFARLAPALQQDLIAQNGGPPYSDAYLRFLVRELKPQIDARYRTQPGRDSTFVMGSSMGGLISLYAFSEYPDVFGGAGCLSTHWLMALPGPTAPPSDALFAGIETYLRDKHIRPGRLWFDHGTKGLDSHYGPYQDRIDALLVAQGWRPAEDFVSKVYAGADHTEDDWRARLADSIAFFFGKR
jgi:enterochelin esterase-like enzyme